MKVDGSENLTSGNNFELRANKAIVTDGEVNETPKNDDREQD